MTSRTKYSLYSTLYLGISLGLAACGVATDPNTSSSSSSSSTSSTSSTSSSSTSSSGSLSFSLPLETCFYDQVTVSATRETARLNSAAGNGRLLKRIHVLGTHPPGLAITYSNGTASDLPMSLWATSDADTDEPVIDGLVVPQISFTSTGSWSTTRTEIFSLGDLLAGGNPLDLRLHALTENDSPQIQSIRVGFYRDGSDDSFANGTVGVLDCPNTPIAHISLPSIENSNLMRQLELEVPIDQEIVFSSEGSFDPDGTITSYEWDFGDGSISNEANPTHSFSDPVEFKVTLKVTDNSANSRTVYKNIHVTQQ